METVVRVSGVFQSSGNVRKPWAAAILRFLSPAPRPPDTVNLLTVNSTRSSPQSYFARENFFPPASLTPPSLFSFFLSLSLSFFPRYFGRNNANYFYTASRFPDPRPFPAHGWIYRFSAARSPPIPACQANNALIPLLSRVPRWLAFNFSCSSIRTPVYRFILLNLEILNGGGWKIALLARLFSRKFDCSFFRIFVISKIWNERGREKESSVWRLVPIPGPWMQIAISFQLRSKV